MISYNGGLNFSRQILKVLPQDRYKLKKEVFKSNLLTSNLSLSHNYPMKSHKSIFFVHQI